jgi:tRNA threonylcarbamoyladenosine biosynthesis protein TsaE
VADAGRPWCVATRAPEETRRLGELAGRLAEPGDAFLLCGPVGAGKTVLADGILRGLGVPGPHPSPTFTLVRVYRGRLPVAHVDLYRLGPAGRAGEVLGWEEVGDPAGVTVVEWAEYAEEAWFPGGVSVALCPGDGPEARRLRWSGLGPRGWTLVAALAARWPQV